MAEKRPSYFIEDVGNNWLCIYTDNPTSDSVGISKIDGVASVLTLVGGKIFVQISKSFKVEEMREKIETLLSAKVSGN